MRGKDNRGGVLDSKESRLEHGFGATFHGEIPANELEERGTAGRPKNFPRRILTRQILYLYRFPFNAARPLHNTRLKVCNPCYSSNGNEPLSIRNTCILFHCFSTDVNALPFSLLVPLYFSRRFSA